MGFIDRAFGVDKSSELVDRLCRHWVQIESLYENFLKNTELEDEQADAIREIKKQVNTLITLTHSSKKSFGVVAFEKQTLVPLLGNISNLHSKLSVVTPRQNWVPEAVAFTLDILHGNKGAYQNRGFWFSD
jgi:hypothetical protein